MTENKTYLQFVQEVKQQILRSRYQAAKLVNKELLLLYYSIGKMIFEKVQKEKWGHAIIDNLSKDIQAELPGLRGFSSKNLRNMRLFFEAYARDEIWQLPTAKFQNNSIKQIGQSSTAKIKAAFKNEMFIALSFTHHILLLNKCKNLDERFFICGRRQQVIGLLIFYSIILKVISIIKKGSFQIISKPLCRKRSQLMLWIHLKMSIFWISSILIPKMTSGYWNRKL